MDAKVTLNGKELKGIISFSVGYDWTRPNPIKVDLSYYPYDENGDIMFIDDEPIVLDRKYYVNKIKYEDGLIILDLYNIKLNNIQSSTEET